ncbi:MAG: dolichyl-phosphate-mannose--protein mannosyltransferase [Candidatus Nanopelagicaceae bacterium]
MLDKLKSVPLLLIILIAALVRFINLGRPETLVFDELYYVDGARDLLDVGVEVDGSDAEFVVHPPLGKWLISIGIAIFGDESFGWRFTTALIGIATVVLLYLISLKLFDSEPVALLAASLMALDGLAIVMSRTALLDNFLTFFVLLAFFFLIKERFLLMGIALGAAMSVKWSGLYFLLAFLIIAAIWNVRSFLERKDQRLLSVIAAAPIALLTYIISWVGWFRSDRGWDRDSGTNALSSLWNYHREIYNFHSTLDADHPYRSHPWSWLVMGRPTSFFYESPEGCGAKNCSQEILALGNPLIWWFGTIAIAVVIGYAITRRDRLALSILVPLGAGYLPWFLFPERTMFTFYAISILPFMILAIAYLANELLRHYARATLLISLALTAVFALFLYFLPIHIAQVITYDQWQSRMWLESWI